MKQTILLIVFSFIFGPDISIFTSKIDSTKSWILVDDCAVEVETRDIANNSDKVVKQVNEFCNLGLDSINEKK